MKFNLDLSPEEKLIICCSHKNYNSKKKLIFDEIHQKDINWSILMQRAYDLGLLVIFIQKINEIAPIEVPKDIMAVINEFLDENKLKNLETRKELLHILKTFKYHEIEAVPFLGVILAVTNGKGISSRQYPKINIFIHKNDVSKVINILQDCGYIFRDEHISVDFYIKTQGKYFFRNKINDILLELHWDLGGVFVSNKHGASLFDKNELSEININDVTFSTFNPENLLCIISLFIANQNWEILTEPNDVSLYDIFSLVENNDINWSKVIKKAKKWGILRILLINLFTCQHCFGLEIDERIQSEMASDKSVEKYANYIMEKMFVGNNKSYGLIERALFNYHIRENKWDGIKDGIMNAITPSYLEFRRIDLPEYLYYLYYLLRPIYLIERFGLGPFKPILPSEYSTSSIKVIDEMLKMAEVNSGDTVYDLGCGDGRIVIRAAEKYGARGVGIDNNPKLIKECLLNAQEKGVEHLTTFINEDFSKTDLSDATVLTMYLYPSTISKKLIPKFKKELKPGTRLISHQYKIREYEPTKTKIILDDGILKPIYLWNWP